MNLMLLVYPFSLPTLPYTYTALEPHIDAKTMEIHYTKHHQAYIDNLNAALKSHPELHKKTIRDLMVELNELPDEILVAVRNNGGGHFNHSFFWPIMKQHGGGKPKEHLLKVITQTFGSFEKMQEEFNAAAKKVFGSGWAWLCVDKNKKLVIVSTHNQDCPLSQGLEPILGLDVWEHAYYLKYQNKRPDYITAWWNVVNWDVVEQHYAAVVPEAKAQTSIKQK